MYFKINKNNMAFQFKCEFFINKYRKKEESPKEKRKKKKKGDLSLIFKLMNF